MLLTAVEADAGTSKSTGELRAVEVSGLRGGGIISLKKVGEIGVRGSLYRYKPGRDKINTMLRKEVETTTRKEGAVGKRLTATGLWNKRGHVL